MYQKKCNRTLSYFILHLLPVFVPHYTHWNTFQPFFLYRRFTWQYLRAFSVLESDKENMENQLFLQTVYRFILSISPSDKSSEKVTSSFKFINSTYSEILKLSVEIPNTFIGLQVFQYVSKNQSRASVFRITIKKNFVDRLLNR